jgi:haloalkane dehalogenase
MKYRLTQLLPGRELGVLACSIASMVLMVAGCGAQKDTEPPLEKISMKKVSVEGINISYVEEGEGTPLVLVHGIPTSSFLWRDMIEELSAHGRVIAPDLPGFGLSDPPPNGDYSISNYARLLESFLEALSIERATLICHDFGGPIVLTYALRHPQKYERLIILDTFLYTDLPEWGLFYKIAKIWPIGEVFMGLGGKYIARSGLEEGVVDKSRISEAIVQRYYMPDGNPDKLNKTYLGTLRIDYVEDLEFIENNLTTIDKPTLILWGENDTYLPLSLADRIHKDITGSKMEIISNCGHFVQEDQPERATEIIVKFLDG